MKDEYSEIFDFIKKLKIIDTHEHLPSFEKDRNRKTDFFKEIEYFNRDLVSSGLPINKQKKVFEEDIPVKKKWKIIEKYWKICQYTGFGRVINIVAEDLYSIKKIDESTIEELNERFLKNLKEGYFKKILKEKCKIETSLLNVETLSKQSNFPDERSIFCDKNLYNPVYIISNLIYPNMWSNIEKIENQSNIGITSFDRWLEATETILNKAIKLGAVALKNTLSYERTLKYNRTSKSEAEKEFYNIFKSKHFPEWFDRPAETGIAFQDYMFHFILDLANAKNWVIQIHTGLHEGFGNILSNSNPLLLSNLFLEYPNVYFDILHMGYPFQNELVAICKNFHNVFINMSWSTSVSPNSSIKTLIELIDTVPLNKISAFGGDCCFIDGVYGQLKLTQHIVSKALASKVKEKLFNIDKAKEIAKRLFYDNPKELYSLKV